MNIESFETAFRDPTCGCVRTCACGRVFYHNDSGEPGWEPGEFASLTQNKNATPLDWCPSDMTLEGKEYVLDCTCWHTRAHQLMSFIDAHARQIARYLTEEKERKLKEAKAMPTVET